MKSLLVYLFLLFTSSVFSQIFVTNRSSEPIWVATVTYQNNGSFSGYVSDGWYKIIPGNVKVVEESCMTVITHIMYTRTAQVTLKHGDQIIILPWIKKNLLLLKIVT